MGRKNWMFINNIESGQASGNLYSLIISCKFNNINPKEYLEYVFSQLPYISKTQCK